MEIHQRSDHESAVTYAQRMAGPAATALHRLAKVALGEGAHLWLSGSTVWAVRPDGDLWTVYAMTDAEAAVWAQTAAAPVFEVLVDPTEKITTAEDRDRVLDAWEDFRDLYLSVLGAGADDPAEVDQAIRLRIEQARRWMSVLGFLRASHLRLAFGVERGAQAAAARALDVSPAAISGTLADDERFWTGWHYDVNEILAGRPPREPFELD